MTTILIVDDNSTSRRMLGYTLSKHGYTIVTAENGRDALAQLDAQPIDLILSDIAMPEMDGVALARAIKADPVTAGTRLVLLALMGQRFEATARQAAQLDGCLGKPVKPARLREALVAVLSAAGSAAARPATRRGQGTSRA